VAHIALDLKVTYMSSYQHKVTFYDQELRKQNLNGFNKFLVEIMVKWTEFEPAQDQVRLQV